MAEENKKEGGILSSIWKHTKGLAIEMGIGAGEGALAGATVNAINRKVDVFTPGTMKEDVLFSMAIVSGVRGVRYLKNNFLKKSEDKSEEKKAA